MLLSCISRNILLGSALSLIKFSSLDLLENLVGCSHECNFPKEVKEKLKVTSSKIRPNLSMLEIDYFVKKSQESNCSIGTSTKSGSP